MSDGAATELEHGILPSLQRLSSEQYIDPRAPLRVFHQVLSERVKVHWHDFYEMFLVVGGTGTHLMNGTAFPLGPGSLFLLTPADLHEFIPTTGNALDLFNVIFADEMVDDEVRGLLFSGISGCATLSGLEPEFRRLWAETVERGIGHRRMIQGTLERILIELARRNAPADGADRHPHLTDSQRKIHRALVYLHHHFREPLTLERVARQAYLSPHYFSECFHRATGSTFQSYLGERRLRFSCSLLQVTDMSVSDICSASGFSSLSHFERVFKQKYGQSPRVYRRKRPAPVAARQAIGAP